MVRECPICGRGKLVERPFEALHLRVPAGRGVFRCADCTHVFLDPPYSIAEAAAIYRDDYYDGFESTVGMAGDGPDGAAPHLRVRLAKLSGLVRGRRLLDVGCGRGSFLAYAARQGWDVRGVDISDDAVSRVRATLGLTAEAGEIESFEFARKQFDLIHANHVIEHLRDPLDALRRFRRWISDDGVLALEVPNEFENLFFRLGRRILPRSQMVRHEPSPHVQFFSLHSLRAALEHEGFEVLELFTARWQVGTGSRAIVRVLKRAVATIERMANCSGNIVAIARPRK